LVRDYLIRNVVLEFGENEYEGMKLFLEQAARLDALLATRNTTR